MTGLTRRPNLKITTLWHYILLLPRAHNKINSCMVLLKLRFHITDHLNNLSISSCMKDLNVIWIHNCLRKFYVIGKQIYITSNNAGNTINKINMIKSRGPNMEPCVYTIDCSPAGLDIIKHNTLLSSNKKTLQLH